MLILGLDPGAKNFAWALLDTKDLTLKGNGYLIPVEGEDFISFSKRFEDLLDTCTPNEVIFERYQFRGVQSTTAEPVNLMLGQIIKICDSRNLPWYRVTASQWKNHYKKVLKKGQEYSAKDEIKPNRPDFGLKDHEADAGCIAHYLETYWRKQKPIAQEETEKRNLKLQLKKEKAKKLKKKVKTKE